MESKVLHTAVASKQPAPAEHHAGVMSTLASGGKSPKLRGKVGDVLCGVPPERKQSLRHLKTQGNGCRCVVMSCKTWRKPECPV